MHAVKSARLFLIMSLAALPRVHAESLAALTVALGGDNHAGSGSQGFTPGDSLNDQVCVVGQVITWDVTLAVSGIQASGPGSGYPVWGAANIVYDLELRRGSSQGELVQEAIFFSTANPGEAAAFARSYGIGGAGPARLIDTMPDGGPFLGMYTYPRDTGDGRLLGMGAGYMQWKRSGPAQSITTPGVGMSLLPDGSPGLNVVPITEGQIDTSLMSPDVYVLRVLPCLGFNVLRGDVDLWQDQWGFATAVDQAAGDEITFTLVPEPAILAWRSVRTHGDVELGIELDPAAASAGEATTEPRRDGVERLEIDFDTDVTPFYTPGHVDIAGGLNLLSDQLINNGLTLEILVSGSADGSCYRIDISDSFSVDLVDSDCYLATLAGDSNDDQDANFIDVSQVKSLAGQTAATRPRADYNTDGRIDFIDVSAIKSLVGASVACP